jgi:5-methylcytosine-specific restriction enzyme A
MIIFKTDVSTLKNVLAAAKHAVNGRPTRAKAGDIILVAQTVETLQPGQKSINWIMEYVRSYEDTEGETIKLWGRSWRYIVEARSVRQVEPFNIDELQRSNKNYGAAVNFTYLDPEDEEAVLAYIGEVATNSFDEREEGIEDLELSPQLNLNELIAQLDKKYSATPEYKQVVTRRLERPNSLRSAIIARDSATCKLCGIEGFKKKGGGQYAELHHMIELNEQAPKTLQSWNVLVLCPTCHKKMHYAEVTAQYLNPGWEIVLDGKEYIIK